MGRLRRIYDWLYDVHEELSNRFWTWIFDGRYLDDVIESDFMGGHEGAVFPHNVYCQSCGDNITARGAWVYTSGVVACGQSECQAKVAFGYVGKDKDSVFLGKFYNADEVQERIRKGRATRFGEVEKIVST